MQAQGVQGVGVARVPEQVLGGRRHPLLTAQSGPQRLGLLPRRTANLFARFLGGLVANVEQVGEKGKQERPDLLRQFQHVGIHR